MNPALLSFLGPIVSQILTLFKKVQNEEIEMAKLEVEIKRLLSEQFKATASLLEGQIEINKREAEAGRLGWRNWLGYSATVAFIYGLLGMPIIESILALGTLIGLPVSAVIQVQALLPTFDYRIVFELLMGLLGLYGIRSWEKTKYSQQRLDFNRATFYESLRQANGGSLDQNHVNILERALNEVLKK